MLSLNKFLISAKSILNPRFAASFQSANFSSIEERLGLPQRPKKPLTPYFRFLTEIRPKVTKENPNLSITDTVKLCAKKWAECDENIKRPYEEAYMKEKEKFINEIAKYESKLTDEHRAMISEAREDMEIQKEKRAYRKKIRENDKPKKPASGFLRYLKEMNATESRGDKKFHDHVKSIAEKWNALPESKKNVYNEACRNENIKYKQELTKWELKMIRLGNTDIVRQEALLEPQKSTKSRKAGRSHDD
ncbi:CLUMA_CG015010, isoform A [Clunio marinus]|uniref:CLUMA_CG015010, isoform A n=1 Tax=Clunio marinus TaxID=568069 RepID=A0A1J1IPZ4_9DIPT|nr:CLUMA_CG015010, isoform A [Clunio marinus]